MTGSDNFRDSATPRACASLLMQTMPNLMRAIMGAARRRNPEGFELITMEQTHLLAMLDHGVNSLRDLAALHRVTPSTMSRSIDVLVRNGWVTREDDPADRRHVIVRVTSEGQAANKAKVDLIQDELTRLLEQVAPEQLAQVASGFDVLGTLLARHLADTTSGFGPWRVPPPRAVHGRRRTPTRP